MDVERTRLGSVIYENLSVLQAGMRTVLNEAVRTAGLETGLNDRAILQHLAAQTAGISLSGLAEFLGASRGLVRQSVKRLSADKLIVSRDDPGDRRSRLWQASESGEAVVGEDLGSVSEEFPVVRAVASLGPDERVRLVNQLDDLIHQLADPSAEFGKRRTASEHGGDEPVTGFDAFFAIWLTVARAYRYIRSEQTRFLLEATGQAIDTPAYMALYRLHERPETTAGIAAFLRVDQNTAARLIDRLKQHGLIVRTRSSANRREVINSASEKGARLLGGLPPVDPAGRYLATLRSLPSAGLDLEEILGKAVAGYVDEPVIDHQVFYALLKQVSETLSARAGSKVEGLHFRSAMAQFLTGVAVVTVGEANAVRAITVNSLTSVSLDPPILLVCFDRRSPSLRALLQRKSFGVSILSEKQKDLADRFGRRETDQNPHAVGPELLDELGGIPMLAGSLTRIVCDLEHSLEAGTHTVVFGAPRLVAMHEEPAAVRPLGYWRSRYSDLRTE